MYEGGSETGELLLSSDSQYDSCAEVVLLTSLYKNVLCPVANYILASHSAETPDSLVDQLVCSRSISHQDSNESKALKGVKASLDSAEKKGTEAVQKLIDKDRSSGPSRTALDAAFKQAEDRELQLNSNNLFVLDKAAMSGIRKFEVHLDFAMESWEAACDYAINNWTDFDQHEFMEIEK